MRIWQCSRSRWISALQAAALALVLVACPSTEERIEEAQQAVPEALARGDRMAARAAVADLGSGVPETPEKLLEIAGLLQLAGESPRALWLLEAGAERFPDDADVQIALAKLSLSLSNPAQARSVVLRIPEDAPQHAEALVLLAHAELGLGQLEQALATLKRAEELYPDRPESLLVRISTLTTEKRHDEAAAAIEEALAAAPAGEDSAGLRRTLELMRAQVQLTQGESEPAIAALRTMVEEDPSDLRAWQLLVQGLGATGQIEEAVALLEAAIAKDDTLHDLYALLAPAYAAGGRKEDAEQALRTYAEGSDSPAAVEPLVVYLAAQGDGEGVLEVARSAVERFPEEAQLRLLYVEALLDQQDLDGARRETEVYSGLPGASKATREYLEARFELAEGDSTAAAERLRRLAPELDLASTQFWLGVALEREGDIEGARRRYGMAQQRDPSWPVPTLATVSLAIRRGAWREVAGSAQQLVSRAPGNVDGWLALCRAFTELELADPLLGASDRAIVGFPERAEFRIARAHALRLQGKPAEALAELDEAAKVQADDPLVAANRAVALAMLGRPDDGMAAATAAAEAYPDSAAPQRALATLSFARGDGETGSRAIDRALELEPDDPAPLLDRCRFRASTMAWEGAIEDCTRYVAARPADAAGYYLLGAAQSGRGDLDAAITSYRRAAELDEADFRAPNNLAVLLAQKGDLDGALEAGQEAYRLSGENPYVADTLGDLYLQKGLVDRAISLLEEAHAAAPDMPDARLHLAQAYARAGRSEEARKLLEGLAAAVPPEHALQPQVQEELRALR
jgi:tetratricopeptide (TPR) repeat protein